MMCFVFSTAKYSFFSFFIKFPFEQFRRYANCFFLFIALMQVRTFSLVYIKYVYAETLRESNPLPFDPESDSLLLCHQATRRVDDMCM